MSMPARDDTRRDAHAPLWRLVERWRNAVARRDDQPSTSVESSWINATLSAMESSCADELERTLIRMESDAHAHASMDSDARVSVTESARRVATMGETVAGGVSTTETIPQNDTIHKDIS